jgi:hypothetical protein
MSKRSAQVTELSSRIESELVRVERHYTQLEKKQSDDLKKRMDKQEADLGTRVSAALGEIEQERKRVSSEAENARKLIGDLTEEVNRILRSLKDYKGKVEELNEARKSLDKAVFDSGSFVLKEKQSTRIVLGREKPSEFLVNVPRVRRDSLHGVSIRDPSERLLYPTGTGREEADVDVGKEITFSDDEYEFIIKVRYTHEQFLTKDVAGVDIERRRKQ